MRKFLFLIATFLTTSFAFAQAPVATYIHCGNLLDVNINQFSQEKTIVVENDVIKDILDGYATPSGGIKTIDLKDKYVMPGFIDMHVHLEIEMTPKFYEDKFRLNKADIALQATVFCEKTLMAGFTTVRDLGGSGVNVSLRNAINHGFIKGPRVYTSEKSIATTGGHADPTNGVRDELKGDPGPKEGVINGPEDAYKAVRQRYKNGADCIKITSTGGVLSVAKNGQGPQFTLEEIKAIVAAAKDYGFTTAAHAHGAEGMKRAIKGGINSIEHGTLMDDEAMELMIKHGTYLVPTLSAGRFVLDKAKIPGYFPPVIVPKALHIGEQMKLNFGKAYRKGVKIAFGTDTGVSQHGKNAEEFIFMNEYGMPALETIQTATKNAAELLQIYDKVGSIEKGKWADIVAVNSNPKENISTLLDVIFVMKSGQVYKE
ncbi:metal-dependent hydrolase family protein [Portibacter lacus]|uniref:Xaa-Pro dipeptidase n=1 Tax=Portibacter lacus TaxID=1099794 RepID=A0AA37WHI0_9BACT|nr:amidohydrolase family protein [Portibacter lacus]GLR19379.1 Xaa-Pro dipeptidase [Portibacter lacus]